jgi:hypothetical protein
MYLKQMVALILSATMFMSCNDQTTKLTAIEDDKQVPTLEFDSLNINYTENGILRMNMQTLLMQRFMLSEEPYNIFPKGLHIYFHTAEHVLESEIVADYAFNQEKPEETWKAIGNVVIQNYLKQQTLYTDTLYWNRAQKTIHTDAPVRIVTPDNDLYGRYGMTSDERFENYEIRAIHDSPFYINMDEEAAADSTAAASDNAAVKVEETSPAPTLAPPAVIKEKPLSRDTAKRRRMRLQNRLERQELQLQEAKEIQ